jgi:hypothetical protein
MKIRLIIVAFVGFVSLIFGEKASGALQDTSSTIYLESIPVVSAPEIQENRIKYTILFVFDTCPEDQWTYYDSKKKQLVIDFYGTHIVESSKIVLRGLPVAKSIEIKNLPTQMSLKGMRSQIVLTLDSFWSYETVVISKNVLQLKIWKSLNPAETLKKNKRKFVVPLLVALVSTVAASLTVVILTILNDS